MQMIKYSTDLFLPKLNVITFFIPQRILGCSLMWDGTSGSWQKLVYRHNFWYSGIAGTIWKTGPLVAIIKYSTDLFLPKLNVITFFIPQRILGCSLMWDGTSGSWQKPVYRHNFWYSGIAGTIWKTGPLVAIIKYSTDLFLPKLNVITFFIPQRILGCSLMWDGISGSWQKLVYRHNFWYSGIAGTIWKTGPLVAIIKYSTDLFLPKLNVITFFIPQRILGCSLMWDGTSGSWQKPVYRHNFWYSGIAGTIWKTGPLVAIIKYSTDLFLPKLNVITFFIPQRILGCSLMWDGISGSWQKLVYRHNFWYSGIAGTIWKTGPLVAIIKYSTDLFLPKLNVITFFIPQRILGCSLMWDGTSGSWQKPVYRHNFWYSGIAGTIWKTGPLVAIIKYSTDLFLPKLNVITFFIPQRILGCSLMWDGTSGSWQKRVYRHNFWYSGIAGTIWKTGPLVAIIKYSTDLFLPKLIVITFFIPQRILGCSLMWDGTSGSWQKPVYRHNFWYSGIAGTIWKTGPLVAIIKYSTDLFLPKLNVITFFIPQRILGCSLMWDGTSGSCQKPVYRHNFWSSGISRTIWNPVPLVAIIKYSTDLFLPKLNVITFFIPQRILGCSLMWDGTSGSWQKPVYRHNIWYSGIAGTIWKTGPLVAIIKYSTDLFLPKLNVITFFIPQRILDRKRIL